MKLSWKLCPERVCDGYSFNLQSMLQVFAVEGFTARVERGGNDQAVIEATDPEPREIVLVKSLADKGGT